MRTLFACLWISSAVCAQAASRAQGLVGSPTSAPALGGLPVNSRPLGGIGVPGTRSATRSTGTGYIGPIYYVPSASDLASYDYWNSLYAPAPLNNSYGAQPPAPVQPPPIIINQYFDSKMPAVPGAAVPGVDAAPQADDAVKPGDPLSDTPNYYLIAYKDHTVYPALAYWLEGDTLHYVTTQNTHNQVTLSLIDLDKTYKLNEDRSVPFSIPGK